LGAVVVAAVSILGVAVIALLARLGDAVPAGRRARGRRALHLDLGRGVPLEDARRCVPAAAVGARADREPRLDPVDRSGQSRTRITRTLQLRLQQPELEAHRLE